MVRTAQQLHAAAVEAVNRGHHGRALRLLDAAASSAPEDTVRARLDGTRALILARSGELGPAEALCLGALATPGLDGHTVAVLKGQLGTIASRAGRLDDAERWLSHAIHAMAEDVPRAHLLVNRSYVRIQRHRLGAAASDCSAAETVYRDHGLVVDAAEAAHNSGCVALLRGDLVSAMQQMARAHTVLAGVSAVTGAVCDLDRAAVLRDAGATREAESLLRRADGVYARVRMPKDRADAELQLAHLLLAQDPRRAGLVAAAAERRFRRLDHAVLATRAAGLRARAQLARGDLSGRRRGESVADDLDAHGLHDDAAAVRLTRIVVEARAPVRSQRSRRIRPPRVPRGASLETRLLAAEARAVRAAADGKDGDSLRHAAAGLDLLSGWQRTFGSLDLQSSVADHGAGLVRAGLAAAVRSGRADVLFDWSERVRRLHQQVTPLRPPPDDVLAADLAELRVLRADGAGWDASARARELRESVRARQWAVPDDGLAERRVALADLQQVLGADEAHLAFVFSGEAATALVVTGTTADILPVPGWSWVRSLLSGLRADLDMVATVRTGPLAAVVRRSLDERLAAISRGLLDDALTLIKERRVMLTAPGVLAGLPWAMLPGLRGRVFTSATSATRWVQDRRPVPASACAGFVVGPRVRRGEEEVGAGASVWHGATVLSGAGATVAATTDLAATVDVLHVAAHGRHTVDNPLFSGLELTDGALFGYDVDLVSPVPGVVVLSSCEVGRSSVRGGEEAIGMTRVWLHAGTRAVIATPVVVADDDACEVLSAVHSGLAAGRTPSEALAEASARTGIVSSFQVHGSGF